MGCYYSTGYSKESEKRSKEIDQIIRNDSKSESYLVKILLLGAGESGKSTIVKQMRIIHLNGYNDKECMEYRSIVYSNTIQSLTAIIRAMGQLKIEFNDPDRIEDARKVFSLGTSVDDGPPNEELFKAMARLWKDSGIQTCFGRSSEYQLNDSAAFFLNSLDRLSSANYVPSVQDVLHTRVKTTGIVETNFVHKGIRFNLVDVGGQRSERRKWIYCFEGVMTLIFVVALSEYDQFLKEESEVNRMHESLKLFDSVCNNQWFLKSSIILFLNKKDLFSTKVSSVPLSICFPEYKGSNSYDEASDYIRKKFDSLNRKSHKTIYSHFTCATDTSNIDYVFNVITENIISKNVSSMAIF